MRKILGLLIFVLASAPANAALIQIGYTGTYSGTTTTGNPAISQFTTVVTDPTPFSLTFVFNTSTPFAYYSETGSGSFLSSGPGGPSVGYVTGVPFGASGTYHADDTASLGQTSQSLVDLTLSKAFSFTPSLYMNVSHPDIPAN